MTLTLSEIHFCLCQALFYTFMSARHSLPADAFGLSPSSSEAGVCVLQCCVGHSDIVHVDTLSGTLFKDCK